MTVTSFGGVAAMSEQKSRLDWVDAAKGISIFLVVMMHSAYGVGDATGHAGYLHYIIGWATPFRMPEFFLISGLFLSEVIGRDWLRFADRRAVHYLYFYALWAVLQIGFKVGHRAGDPAQMAPDTACAVIEPYGVLWFIYMLAVFSLATKLLHELRAPHWAVLAFGAALQIVPVNTGSGIVDEFSAYFVYFYGGYALAPHVFTIVAWAQRNTEVAVGGLAAYALINAALVFGGGFEMTPVKALMGYAALPGLHLVLAFAGSIALCVTAALLMKLKWMDWLRWLGAHSIVVYLSFSIPMAASRTLLLKLGVIDDTSIISTIVFLTALLSPLALYGLIQWTGRGKFLFERPAWAHLPGTPGSRSYETSKALATPAE
jgi:uncharacterized membrane protein YcfT